MIERRRYRAHIERERQRAEREHRERESRAQEKGRRIESMKIAFWWWQPPYLLINHMDFDLCVWEMQIISIYQWCGIYYTAVSLLVWPMHSRILKMRWIVSKCLYAIGCAFRVVIIDFDDKFRIMNSANVFCK